MRFLKSVLFLSSVFLMAAECRSTGTCTECDYCTEPPSVVDSSDVDSANFADFELIAMLEGHSEKLWCLDAGTKGRFVSGGEDGQIIIWNAESLEPQVIDRSGRDLVEAVRYMKTGEVLSLNSRSVIRQLDGSGVSGVFEKKKWKRFAVNHNESMFAGFRRGWIDILSIFSMDIIASYKCSADCFEMVFSPDNEYLYMTGHEGSVLRFSLDSGEFDKSYEGLTYDVHCIDITHDGRYIAAGSTDCRVKVWDTETGENLATIYHRDGLYDLDISADGSVIVSAGVDKKVIVAELLTGKVLANLRHKDEVHAVAIDPEGKYIVAGGYDSAVYLWGIPEYDLSSLDPINTDNASQVDVLHTIKAHNAPSFSIAISHDNSLVATAGRDNRVCLWNTSDFQLKREIIVDTPAAQLDFSADDSIILGRSERGSFYIWDSNSGEVLDKLDNQYGIITGFDLSSDDRFLVSGGLNGKVTLWDFDTMTPLKEKVFDNFPIVNIRFSPDDDRILFAYAGSTGDFSLRALNRNLEEVYRTDGHTGYNYHTSFARKKNLFATAGADALIKIWNLGNGSLSGTLDKHRYKVMDTDFSPCENLLVSGSAHDKTVRIWDVDRQSLLKTFRPGCEVQCVEFSPDGRYFISSGEDGVLRFWGIKRPL